VSEENIAVVRRAFAAFNERDLAATLELFDPEMEFLPQQTATLAREGRPYRGHDGVREYFEDVARLWKELDVIPQEYRDLDDTVLALGRVYARGTDGLLVDSPTGWVWRLRDGKVIACRVYPAQEDALEAVGLRQ
jgi:ketosteroid isomerase-like protein